MEAKAYLKYARISPRKVQIVLDLIRGKDVATAMGILNNTPRAASELLIKLLKCLLFFLDPLFGCLDLLAELLLLILQECGVCRVKFECLVYITQICLRP